MKLKGTSMKRIFGIVALAAMALSGCKEKPVLNVVDAVVRLPAVPRSPAAAYFTITGGPAADRLIEVTSENAIRAEIHESMAHDGVASMKPIESGVEIPAKSVVKFESGGKHVMFFDVNPALQPPRTMPITFIFASGERIIADATLKRAGEQ
jgi:copper(I)-binding protein